MISHTQGFQVAVTIFFVLLLWIGGRSYLETRHAASNAWETLMGRLVLVDRDKIALIATDLLRENDGDILQQASRAFEPSHIWELIGGLEGVEVLEANCDVLIDLAYYLQRWHPEALVVAEQLRLNAREIKWHISRLQGAAQLGNLEHAFPDYAQRAVMIYYLMTRQLLALYEAVAASQFAELQRAL